MTKLSLTEAFQGEFVTVLSQNPGGEPLTTAGFFIDEDYEFAYLALSIAPGKEQISIAVRKDKITHVMLDKQDDPVQRIFENAARNDEELN